MKRLNKEDESLFWAAETALQLCRLHTVIQPKKGEKVQLYRIIKILLMGKIKFHSPFIHVYASTSVAKKQ